MRVPGVKSSAVLLNVTLSIAVWYAAWLAIPLSVRAPSLNEDVIPPASVAASTSPLSGSTSVIVADCSSLLPASVILTEGAKTVVASSFFVYEVSDIARVPVNLR